MLMARAAVFPKWLHEYYPLKRQLSLASRRSTYWLIMWSSKTERKTSSVASAVWHVAPSCWNQMFHGLITIAIDCSGLSLLIFEEKRLNYASGPKSASNSDSFLVRRLFNVCVRIFCAPNAKILFVYIPATIKMRFSWKDDFFCQKINVTIFPSVVQAYTQPYLFGGSVKLIICQTRHELSITIHKISTG